MKETKAIQILKALTPEEFKNFGKFVESPYFNSSKNVIKLYNIIKKYYPEFENKALDVESVYKKLYPSQNYNEGTIRNIISEMGQLAEKFLSQEYYKDKEYIVKFGELCMLRDKNISGLKEKLLDSLLEKYGKAKGFMEDHFKEGIALNEMKLDDVFEEGLLHKNTYVYTQRTEYAMFFALDYMIHSKLETKANQTRNISYIDYCAKMYDCFDFEKFLEYIKENSPELYKVIAIEYYVVKMNLNVDFSESADKFEKLFYKNYKTFSKGYLYSLHLNFSNSYIYQINSYVSVNKAAIYAKKLLDFYDVYLREKVYKPFYICVPTEEFLNLVRVSDVAGDYEKMKKYIEGFKDEINPDERDTLYNFGMGQYYLGTENYEKSLNSYIKIVKPSMRLSLEIKSGMMACHFYLKNYETALSFTDSFIRDADRKIKGKTGSAAGIIQVKYLRRLLKILMSPSLEGLDELEHEIKKSPLRHNAKILKMIGSVKKK